MTPNISLEKKILISLALVFYTLITISVIHRQAWNVGIPWLILHYTDITSWIVVFYGQVFWLFPSFFIHKKYTKYFLFLIIIVVVLFLFQSSIKTMDFQQQGIKKHHISRTFFEAYFYFFYLHLKWLMKILIVILVSTGYLWIKQSIQKGLLKVKTLIISAGIILLLGFLSLAGICYYYSSYDGSGEIKFISNSDRFRKAEDLFNQKEFKGNVLYVDLWSSNCSPCIKEFQYLKDIKEHYKDDRVIFVYLVNFKQEFIKHAADVSKWKSLIKKYHLAGYHMQMNIDLTKDIWTMEGINNAWCIPHYIIVDKNGKVAVPNAETPSSGEKLYKQLDDIIKQQIAK